MTVLPVAVAGGPYTVREGASLSLSAAGSYDTTGPPLAGYTWDLNGDNVFGDATGVSPTLSWSQLVALGIGTSTVNAPVQVRVTDSAGDSSTAGSTLSVAARRVAVVSIENDSVRKYNSSGAGAPFAGAAQGLLGPMAAVYDSAGNLYVADFLTQRINKFTPGGAASVFAGVAQGVLTPTGLAIDAADNVYVANYLVGNVLKITPAGVSSVLASAADGLVQPFDVAVDGGGNVYATSIDAGKVWKISAPHAVSVYGDATDGLLAPLSVATDAAGNVYVADFFLGSIKKFTAAHADTFFVAPGGVPAASDLAFDSVTGNLYVSQYLAANRIALVTPAGAVSTFADATSGVSLSFAVAVGYAVSPPAPPPAFSSAAPPPSAATSSRTLATSALADLTTRDTALARDAAPTGATTAVSAQLPQHSPALRRAAWQAAVDHVLTHGPRRWRR